MTEHTHRLDPGQLAEILDVLRPQPHSTPPPEPRGPITLPDLVEAGIEPWSFHDPHTKQDVTAYVDDRNQVRHVPVSRASEVPKAWRRVLLA